MTNQTHRVACPVCGELKCLCRPRFFAGQLLTEQDLNDLECYIIEKNKLHNRYLHGPGVVCGLQVVCHECDGWVTVKQGYAIDPCGNDIIVCEDHDLNVIQAIRKCREALRRPAECEPPRVVVDEPCKDVEERWCIAIAYEEREARPIGTLRQEGPCSQSQCHGNNGGKSRATVRVPGRSGSTVAPCEPTRILESYRLGVFRAPEGPCLDRKQALEGTLPHRLLACFTSLREFLAKYITVDILLLSLDVAFGSLGPVASRAGIPRLRTQCCALYLAVKELYDQNPANVRCAALEDVHCPEPPQGDLSDEVIASYVAQVRAATRQLLGLLVQYLVDCACQALLPPCAPDPLDDRLILACLTIQEDKILHICNFSCRQFAGSFASLSYWLPIQPLIITALERLCCDPQLLQRLGRILASHPKQRTLYHSIAADDFAIPKAYATRISRILGKVSLAGLAEFLQPEGANLVELTNRPVGEARGSLEEAGVKVVEKTVASEEDVPAFSSLSLKPFARAGDAVVAYRVGDKIVAYGRYDPQEELEALRGKLERLTIRVEELGGP